MKFRQIIIAALILTFVPSAFALSQENYTFERMWPTLQQPWYFHEPIDVATDKDNFVYITDKKYHYIQKFTADGQFIAKWHIMGTSGPFGIACDTKGFIYVTDVYGIQKFISDGEFVEKWDYKAIESGGLFVSIAVDFEDFVYVFIQSEREIQKFTTDGKFIKAWPIHDKESEEMPEIFSGIAIDNKGSLYVVDSDNNRIQKFTTDGSPVDEWESEGELDRPSGIAIGPDNNIYVSDMGNHRIRKFGKDGKSLDRWGSKGSGNREFETIFGLTVNSNNVVYVGDWNNHSIQKFDSEGTFLAKWGSHGGANGEFNFPEGIAIDHTGTHIYVGDSQNNRVQKLTIEGKSVQWGSAENNMNFNRPRGITVDHNGFVYVADSDNHCIKKLDESGNFIAGWGECGGEPGQFDKPFDVATDKDGNVYVVEYSGCRVQKFDPDGSLITSWGGRGDKEEEFYLPSGIAVFDDFVYVADTGNNRVQKFDLYGNLIEMWEEPGKFDYPSGIATDSNGLVYVSDSPSYNFQNNRIQKFTPDGVVKIGEPGSGVGQLQSPNALCIGSDGKIYVADSGNNRIQVFKPANLTEKTDKAIIIAGGGPYPGNYLWDVTRMTASFAYRALNYQGFAKNDIYYLSSDTELDLDGDSKPDVVKLDLEGDGELDVNGDATKDNFYKIISYLLGKSEEEDIKDLVLYLVNHGGENVFRMNETQTLSASELNSELEKFRDKISGTIFLVYDACKSGTFHASWKQFTDGNHILLTSTSDKENAYFMAQGSVSFSNLFWTHIFNGDHLKLAFNQAKTAIQKATADVQIPHIYPDYTQINNDMHIGNGAQMNWKGPEIYDTPSEYPVSGSSARIHARIKHNDGYPIDHVWAVIIPPPLPGEKSSARPILEMPSVDLTAEGDDDLYEGVYDKFNIKGTYKIIIHARDARGNTSVLENPINASVGNPKIRRAIIVAGGSQKDEQWPVIKKNVNLAYNTLKEQLYSDDDIYLMASETFLSDPETRLPGADNLRDALVRWAVPDTYDVILYMTGKGEPGRFYLSDKELLSAVQLDKWLDELQTGRSIRITVIYDADHAGSFIPLLRPPQDKERIVIAGTSDTQPALFSSQDMISFSMFFWKEVSEGINLRDVFLNTKNAMKPFFSEVRREIPQMDDNGNGVPDERSEGQLAMSQTIGAGIRVTTDVPLADVHDTIILENGETSGTISVENMTTTETVTKVWAVAVPPGHTSGKTDDLPAELTFELKLKQGTYQGKCNDCFQIFGTYQVVVYAEDSEGNLSVCQKFSVYQPKGSDGGADIYEPDDNFDQAGNIISNESQEHNFHTDEDKDWVKFYAMGGQGYAIEAMNRAGTCDTLIRIYDSERRRLTSEDGETLIIRNSTEKWDCPETGIYYFKISPADTSCEETGYDLRISSLTATLTGELHITLVHLGTGKRIYTPTWLTTEFFENPIDIYSEAFIDCHIPHPVGEYTVTIDVEGYGTEKKEGVKIKELLTTPVEFELNLPHRADTDKNYEVGLSELLRVIQIYNSDGYHCAPGMEDDYAPGYGEERSCETHDSDYNPLDWKIGLSELLRFIQFYNSPSGYSVDPGGEEGFSPKDEHIR